jgi:DNA modification methylase
MGNMANRSKTPNKRNRTLDKHLVWLHQGSNFELLAKLPDNSVDSIVTDPPYGIKFMSHKWDYSVPSVELWTECLRVLKPGGHLLSFSSSRTYHRMVVAVEDAGFEIRDMIVWCYATGFAKSFNVGKAISAYERFGSSNPQALRKDRMGKQYKPAGTVDYTTQELDPNLVNTNPDDLTPNGRRYLGVGTALKPNIEPIVLARKPLSANLAKNVLRYQTGGLNVDACRFGTHVTKTIRYADIDPKGRLAGCSNRKKKGVKVELVGSFPSNMVIDQSEEVTRVLRGFKPDLNIDTAFLRVPLETGTGVRTIYCNKASDTDRNEGCEPLMLQIHKGKNRGPLHVNNHSTVKPTELMRYLCRLVTPVGGTVLDPYTGSGSTGKAAILEGYRFIGAELQRKMMPIIAHRVAWAARQKAAMLTTDHADRQLCKLAAKELTEWFKLS